MFLFFRYCYKARCNHQDIKGCQNIYGLRPVNTKIETHLPHGVLAVVGLVIQPSTCGYTQQRQGGTIGSVLDLDYCPQWLSCPDYWFSAEIRDTLGVGH